MAILIEFFLTKESERKEILMRIERVLEQSALVNENRLLRDQLERQSEFGEMVGDSAAMREKVARGVRERWWLDFAKWKRA